VSVQIRLLLGPAGGGKTFRCLTEIRRALTASLEGPPLLLVAPKQTTYQLERQLLADPSISGFTRLHILSFDRLAHFVFEQLGKSAPRMLDEEGRLMVLRGLLAKKRTKLKLFRASARLTGFAQQLSLALSELQRSELTPESLDQLAGRAQDSGSLALKLHDLATLLRDYLAWLDARHLQDADSLLASATRALSESAQDEMKIGSLWVDGFSEWSAPELELLAALVPRSERATLTFCLDRLPAQKLSWLSNWSVASQTFEECRNRLGGLPGAELAVELLERQPDHSRFSKNPVLQHLEEFWAEPQIYEGSAQSVRRTLRVAACADPEGEVTLAAREILRYVRAGGRYREVTVLVRQLSSYHDLFQRLFARYEIPFFLDRREAVSHHPLAQLTRSALRTVASQWLRDDWFAALKTGLVPATDEELDHLENEALARGWQGAMWHKPIALPNEPDLESRLSNLLHRILPPFQRVALALGVRQNKPTGPQLTAALRAFWGALDVERRLEEWAAAEISTADFRVPNSVHATVWEQMNAWLDNVELAFPDESLSLREWLPILEAGLSSLSVGVIPPALDQVLIGSVDRSHNPDITLALVLGLNETVFPAQPETAVLLTEADRVELEKSGVVLGATARQHLGRERHLAYIACTRARQRLVLTRALSDTKGSPLNESPFLAQVRRLFPSLESETIPAWNDWRESEHANELVAPLLKIRASEALSARDGLHTSAPAALERLAALPALAATLEQLRHFQNPDPEETLAPELAARLYGPALRTSVSRMEQFAACPFKFFVHSGLRAEERKKFELDVKEQGSFQHEALACFHEELRAEKKRWRDVTPAEARDRMGRIARGFLASYRDGLLQASEQSRFLARILTESLQDFVETLVDWMRGQYRFDPVEVELPFGAEDGAPAWSLELGDGHRLELHGRIDRIDLCPATGDGEALCVVVDYKSSQRKLDPVLMANGLQLQLPAYLNVLRHWPGPKDFFGAARLIPAGVFYVNLRGKYERRQNRLDALADPGLARKMAYRHAGRFDMRALRQLDGRPDAREGDQFNYRLVKDGGVHKASREALATVDFVALLDSVETNLQRMGREIFFGRADVAPYRKGTMTACKQCDYQAICRIDPWTHRFRVLKKEEAPP